MSTWIRTIELDKEEYSFRFSNPKGALTKCTVTDGAGTVTLYMIDSTSDIEDTENRLQVGDPQFLSIDPGNSFYVALNTTVENSEWEIVFRGKGSFELELPERLLSQSKRGMKGKLSNEYDKKTGRRKE